MLAGKVRVAEVPARPRLGRPVSRTRLRIRARPTAAVKLWVHDSRLWVEYEAGRVGLEIDETPRYLTERIPGIEKHIIRADSAARNRQSYLKRHGLPNTVSVEKWPGSVEDGVAHLRSYTEIVIHPRCIETIREARLWSYKVDRLSGDILPVLVDANNHFGTRGAMPYRH